MDKYYVDSSLKTDNQDKWVRLLDLYLPLANEIEFNILNKTAEFFDFTDLFKSEIVSQGKRKDKIYHYKEYIRLRKSEELVNYLRTKPYSSWTNYCLEDLSLIKGGVEFFATITHENYIIIKLSGPDRERLNKEGFDFNIEWPYHETK